MSTPLSVVVLLVKQTADEIFAAALELATLVGLPVTSWRTGDPTRTQLRAQAAKLASADEVVTELAKASFITGPVGQRAEGDWLSLRVKDVYGPEREEASYATPSITINNASGGLYVLDPLAATFSSSATGATYRNQSIITINPLATGVVALLIAETPGSAGSAALNDIDTVVSPTLTGVSVVSSTASSGVDEQSDEGLIEQALATLGALSPNGPADAYEYVARSFALTGIAGVTRAQGSGDSANGTVTVYVATTTAALGAPSVAAIQLACDTWAQPLCTDATVVSGTPVSINITFAGLPAGASAVVNPAIEALFAGLDFGDLVALDAITSAARVACANAGLVIAGAVTLTLPLIDQTLAANAFPVRGTTVYL